MQTHIPVSAEANKQQSHSAQHPAQLLAEQQSAFEDHSPQAAQLTSLQAMMSNSPPQHRTQAMQAKMNGSAQVQQMRTLQTQMSIGDVAQREELKEPLQAQVDGGAVQREEVATASEAPKPNNTGLPDNLKSGIESLSGMSMDHVKVHYNSSQPAQLNAHAYAQGSEIHVAPGQEQHVPHEAWHVVQQAQGRVKPTMQMKGGVAVNDDVGLESEADLMGAKAFGLGTVQMHAEGNVGKLDLTPATAIPVVQRVAITRRMYEIIREAGSIKDLYLILPTLSYSEEVKNYLLNNWNQIQNSQFSFIEEEREPEVDDGEGSETELAFNIVGHQANVRDEGTGGSYEANANAIQFARTPGAMTGPKDYSSTNCGSFEDSFYILDSKGGIDFSVRPTNADHASYIPVGKSKKQSLKHQSITWQSPNCDGVVIDLRSHPNIKNLDKADRDQHFGMADAIYSELKGWKTAKQTADFRRGQWTWHHLPTQYHMILVDMEAHAQHGHNGGVYLW